VVIWLDGFYVYDTPGYPDMHRYGPYDGDMVVINPTDRTRKFAITMSLHPDGSGLFQMKFSGLVDDEFGMEWKQTLERDPLRVGVERRYEVLVPPGRHAMHMHCTPSPQFIPDETRRLCYYVKDFKIEELR
jgi:hypothetical protein